MSTTPEDDGRGEARQDEPHPAPRIPETEEEKNDLVKSLRERLERAPKEGDKK